MVSPRLPFVLSPLVLALSLAACSGAKKPEAEGKNAQKPEPAEPADLVIVGGSIVTMDAKSPRVDAIAVRDGKVQAIGTAAEIEALAGSATRRIDLGGGVCTPGLQDAHAHLTGLGRNLEEVDLRGAKSVEEVIERIRDQAPPEGWITGRGWDQNLWPDTSMPSHEALTAAFPDRPVWLRRVDGHAGWGNLAAMQAAGVGPETPDPEGGELLRDEAGNPTGVLVDTAMGLVPVPAASPEALERWVLAGQAHVLARGITGVHDMGVSEPVDVIYRRLAASEDPKRRLRIRVTGYADADWFEKSLVGQRKPDAATPQSMYTLIGVKAYADGALGSRGAALISPYADRPGHSGKLIRQPDAMEKLATDAMGEDWQVATHAIGDRGNRVVLDAYERAFQRHRKRDHRFRVEHAQIVDVSDIPRFAKLSVIASMQPTHATSDMPWVPARVGEQRLAGAYAWRRFLKAGVHLAFGSDFPVEETDVTYGLYSATTRVDPEGKPEGGWLPDQKLTLDEAIRAFTSEAAFAARREDHLGRLRKEMQADLTCFADDIFQLAPPALRTATIRATIVGGEVMYEPS